MTGQQPNSWAVGWTWFAAVMMWVLGAFHAIAGLVAIVNSEFYVVTPIYFLRLDVTAWGWIHLVVGIVVFVAGVYLLSAKTWARVIAVFLAVLSILGNFAWLPWYPVWSILMITAGVFVIWALTVHAHDIEAA